MSVSNNPSEWHPDLQEDRLIPLAQFFATVCAEVALLHDASAGDDGWSLGCRRNARWRHRLAKKAQSREWPWFSVIKSGKRFVFSIGSVPVRFYRGRHNKPTLNTLAHDAPELEQLSIAFKGTDTPFKDLHYRFAIETGLLGEPTAVVFAGLAKEDGSVVCHWKLPFDAVELQAVAPAEPRIDDIVELPAPVVGVKPAISTDTRNDAS